MPPDGARTEAPTIIAKLGHKSVLYIECSGEGVLILEEPPTITA